MARFRPWLAAMAVDSVVLGPGVKLLTVASTNRALSSEEVMLLNVAPECVKHRYDFHDRSGNLVALPSHALARLPFMALRNRLAIAKWITSALLKSCVSPCGCHSRGSPQHNGDCCFFDGLGLSAGLLLSRRSLVVVGTPLPACSLVRVGFFNG
jgi:hypothetical protein